MTIAKQLKVTEFPFEVKDSKGNTIYLEDSDGYWFKSEYDSNGNEIYYKNSNEFWVKREFDSNNHQIYFENSDGYWFKNEYDSSGNRIYFEDSYGNIIDKRPKPIPEYTMEELVKLLGKEFKIKK